MALRSAGGWRPDGRGNDAGEGFFVQSCEAVEFPGCESFEEGLAHRRVVDDLCASQRLEPRFGQRGEGGAPVSGVRHAADEAAFLERVTPPG